MNEYIIVNKTAIQKRIEELKQSLIELDKIDRKYRDKSWDEQSISIPATIDVFEAILANSTPLIPEIEKAYEAGEDNVDNDGCINYKGKEEYISNLKLDI